MKVGPQKRDVVVNVAPIIVDGVLKGSVGVIHDVSEIKSLTEELSRARQIIRTLEAKYTFEDIKGESEEMTFAVEQARLAASTPATVLLRGNPVREKSYSLMPSITEAAENTTNL